MYLDRGTASRRSLRGDDARDLRTRERSYATDRDAEARMGGIVRLHAEHRDLLARCGGGEAHRNRRLVSWRDIEWHRGRGHQCEYWVSSRQGIGDARNRQRRVADIEDFEGNAARPSS